MKFRMGNGNMIMNGNENEWQHEWQPSVRVRVRTGFTAIIIAGELNRLKRLNGLITYQTSIIRAGYLLIGTWQKFGIPQLKRRATKLAVLKLSCGPQTSKTC